MQLKSTTALQYCIFMIMLFTSKLKTLQITTTIKYVYFMLLILKHSRCTKVLFILKVTSTSWNGTLNSYRHETLNCIEKYFDVTLEDISIALIR